MQSVSHIALHVALAVLLSGTDVACAPAGASYNELVLSVPEHPYTGRRMGPGVDGPMPPLQPPDIGQQRSTAARLLHSLTEVQQAVEAAVAAPVMGGALSYHRPDEVVEASVSQGYTMCSSAPEVLSGVSGRVTLSGGQGGPCRWRLSPSLQRSTDLSIDLTGMEPQDLLQVRLPQGFTMLLWPGMGGPDGDGTWSRTVGSGDIVLELGRLLPSRTSGPTSRNATGSVPPGTTAMQLERLGGLSSSSLRHRPRITAVGLSWWPARQEDDSRGSSATMAALGATMASLMLLLVMGSFCSCIFRCSSTSTGDGATSAPRVAPNRVPTSLRLMLKPTPYGKLGAAGDYFKQKVIGKNLQQQQKHSSSADCVRHDCSHHSCYVEAQQHQQQLQQPALDCCPADIGVSTSAAAAAAGSTYSAAACCQAGGVPAQWPRDHGRAEQHLSGDAAADTVASAMAPQLQPSGGDQVESSATAAAAGTETGCCAICILDLQPESVALVLPCGHIFHHECAVTWLLQSRLCPRCRADVVAGMLAVHAH